MGDTYLALSGLGVKLGDDLNPGRWPGLRYFAPLGLNQRPSGLNHRPSGLNHRPSGLNHRPFGAGSTALWASIYGPLALKILAGFSATSKHLDGRLSVYLTVSQLPDDEPLGSYSGPVPFRSIGRHLSGLTAYWQKCNS